MAKIPLLLVIGAILIIIGIVLYAVETTATVSVPFGGTYACNSQLVQSALHNSSITSNLTYQALLGPCTNAATLQGVGIALIVVGIVLFVLQYYTGRGRRRR